MIGILIAHGRILQGGTQIIRQVTLVPAHGDPRYPGITWPGKIVGADGTVRTRAKNDWIPSFKK